uniref:phosphatidylinositol 3-kinase n=2 Tax=Plectus sambesii TaxID=2011161 RepID=A0A914V3R8_9BILA
GTSQDTPRISTDDELPPDFNEELDETTIEEEESLETSATIDDGENAATDGLPDLASFLIKSACKDAALANYLYWYLKVEVDSYHWRDTTAATGAQPNAEKATLRAMYGTVLRRLNRALGRGGLEAKRRATLLTKQQLFVNQLVEIMKAVAKESGNRKKKIDFLKSRLAVHDKSLDLSNLGGLPLPLDPSVRVQAVMADRASLFNSNLMPCKLTFRTADNRQYVTMFKRGDDLRQDQLVIQMIRLMDKLLRAENLDLRLTPYQVLATSVQDGFVQFIDGSPLRDVIAEWSTIQASSRL